jgi:predicted O-methyltransferase YrrM
MARIGLHLRAAIEGARTGLDTYRERLMQVDSDPRVEGALELASKVEGFVTPLELSGLYHLALAAPSPGRVVEIGSYLGRSTVMLAQAAMDRGAPQVVAVDPHTATMGVEGETPRDTRPIFEENVRGAGVADAVRLLHATSVDAARTWDGDSVQMLFVDGLHTRENVLEDVRSWAPFMSEHRVVAFDDYMVSEGVRAGVRELQHEGAVPHDGVVVGKLAAFAPREVLARVPTPPGGRLLARLGPRFQEAAITCAARRAPL